MTIYKSDVSQLYRDKGVHKHIIWKHEFFFSFFTFFALVVDRKNIIVKMGNVFNMQYIRQISYRYNCTVKCIGIVVTHCLCWKKYNPFVLHENKTIKGNRLKQQKKTTYAFNNLTFLFF